MTQISLQLPPDLLSQVQALAGSPENLQGFLIHAIEQEVQRSSSQRLTGEQDFWHKLQQLHAEMQAEGIEINPDEIWGNVRSRTPGREVNL